MVVVRDAQDARKDLAAALLAYARAPEPDVMLVVTHAGGAKGKALADGLRETGAPVTNAARITRHRERVDFVRDEVRRLGGKCNEDAAEALLAAVGNDLRDLSAACSQLVADTDGRIDRATIARYYRGRAEASGFTVADAAIVGDLSGALEALRWALHVGVDPVPIADALADGVRTVVRVAAAGRGNAYQLASSLGLPAWKVERAQRQCPGLDRRGARGRDEDRGGLQRGGPRRRGGPRLRAGAGRVRDGRGPGIGVAHEPSAPAALLPRCSGCATSGSGRSRFPALRRARSRFALLLCLADARGRVGAARDPVAVAIMVKLNDAVAGGADPAAGAGPAAHAPARATSRRSGAVRVPRPSYPTTLHRPRRRGAIGRGQTRAVAQP